MLVPPEIIDLFQRVIAQTANAFVREEFEKQGFMTAEKRVLSPNPKLAEMGIYTETLPMDKRIEGYFNMIDWEDRVEVSRAMVIVNEHMRRLKYHPSGLLDRVQEELGRHGYAYNGERVVKL